VTFKKNIKDLNPEANIFVKNVPNNVLSAEFEEYFNQFGEVFSSKLNQFDKAECGYGYV
jgi:RNA recognition motif-containing protein